MAKIPFDAKYRPQIESGEYKVETRNGRPARIICWDAESDAGELIALVKQGNNEIVYRYRRNGSYLRNVEHSLDFFIITPEHENDETMQKEQKTTPDWMPKFLDELRSQKNYFDWDEHRDIEGHILAIINWIAPDYFDRKEKEQKSAEWSEEDEKLLDFWLDVIDRNDWRMDENFCKASREFINRIKSFHPQSHWKPSEEQMKALKNCAYGVYQNGDGPVLRELYEDLKKLM